MECVRNRMKDLIYENLRPKMVSLFWRTAEGDGISSWRECRCTMTRPSL